MTTQCENMRSANGIQSYRTEVATTRRWEIAHAVFAEFLHQHGVPVDECIVEGDGETFVSFDGSTSSARCTQGALVVETTRREIVEGLVW